LRIGVKFLSQVASRSISAHDEREIDLDRRVIVEHDIANAIGSSGEDGVDTVARLAGQDHMINVDAVGIRDRFRLLPDQVRLTGQ